MWFKQILNSLNKPTPNKNGSHGPPESELWLELDVKFKNMNLCSLIILWKKLWQNLVRRDFGLKISF